MQANVTHAISIFNIYSFLNSLADPYNHTINKDYSGMSGIQVVCPEFTQVFVILVKYPELSQNTGTIVIKQQKRQLTRNFQRRKRQKWWRERGWPFLVENTLIWSNKARYRPLATEKK